MVIYKYGILRFDVDCVDDRGVLGPGVPNRLRAVVGKGEKEPSGEAVHQVAHLHHIPQDRILRAGHRGNRPLRHALHARLQALPLPTRKCHLPLNLQTPPEAPREGEAGVIQLALRHRAFLPLHPHRRRAHEAHWQDRSLHRLKTHRRGRKAHPRHHQNTIVQESRHQHAPPSSSFLSQRGAQLLGVQQLHGGGTNQGRAQENHSF